MPSTGPLLLGFPIEQTVVKSSFSVLVALIGVLQLTNVQAETFNDSNNIFDFTWSYSGGEESARLTYSYTNKTPLAITPIGASIEFKCVNGQSIGGWMPIVSHMVMEERPAVLQPGETYTYESSTDYTGSNNYPCEYQGGNASIVLVAPPSGRQKGIRQSQVQCGSAGKTAIVEFDPARNVFKIYTAAEIHTLNWKNLVARSKTDTDLADNIAKLICASDSSEESRKSVSGIYKYISQWARYCEKDTEKCIADYRKMTGIGIRG